MNGVVAHLLAQLRDDGGMAVPDVLMVKGRDVDAGGVLGEKLLAKEAVGLGPVGADLVDLDAEGEQLLLHERRGDGGEDDGGRAVEGDGGGGTGQAGIAAGGAVEVNIGGSIGGGPGHEVADAARLEGATRLEVV